VLSTKRLRNAVRSV